jgi:hypothetical protein
VNFGGSDSWLRVKMAGEGVPKPCAYRAARIASIIASMRYITTLFQNHGGQKRYRIGFGNQYQGIGLARLCLDRTQDFFR